MFYLSVAHASTLAAPDRAKVVHLQADLLLPQGGILSVDMNMDCGSPMENTGMIVISEQAAKLLAAGATALYGKKAGQSVLRKWHNKANSDDPRKPTFLVLVDEVNGNLGGGSSVIPLCGVLEHERPF